MIGPIVLGPDLRYRLLPVGGREFTALVEAQRADLVDRGHYTAEEARAMNTPGRFRASWLPRPPDRYSPIAGETSGQVVGWILLLERDDGIGLLESLFVHPIARGKGYARLLVREAFRMAAAAGRETIEVYALDREPETVELWGKRLLKVAPNMRGQVTLLTTPPVTLTAQGWRLNTADVRI